MLKCSRDGRISKTRIGTSLHCAPMAKHTQDRPSCKRSCNKNYARASLETGWAAPPRTDLSLSESTSGLVVLRSLSFPTSLPPTASPDCPPGPVVPSLSDEQGPAPFSFRRPPKPDIAHPASICFFIPTSQIIPNTPAERTALRTG